MRRPGGTFRDRTPRALLAGEGWTVRSILAGTFGRALAVASDGGPRWAPLVGRTGHAPLRAGMAAWATGGARRVIHLPR